MRSEARLLTDPAEISAAFPPPPPPVITIGRVKREMWTTFARYHYMTATLSSSAICLIFRINGDPAAFCALLPNPTRHALYRGLRVHRVCVLPDYEGRSLAIRCLDYCADLICSYYPAERNHLVIKTVLRPLTCSFRREPARWLSLHPFGHTSRGTPLMRSKADSLTADAYYRWQTFRRRSYSFICVGAPRFDRDFAARLVGTQAEVAALTSGGSHGTY